MATVAPIRVGTSGFSYKEWLGDFYPPKLAGTKMLAHYAARLATVEINYTFRAMPRREMLERWASQTPESFRFALKAPQRITHFARLRNTRETVEYFTVTARTLGERLGPTLFQLPPDFKRDLPCLSDFLELIDGSGLRPAFEFRDRSWFDDSVLRTLRDAGAALCLAETEKLATPIERTAPYVYARLRLEDYDDASLKAWARRFRQFADQGAEVFVYFKHELAAPRLAARLIELLGGTEAG